MARTSTSPQRLFEDSNNRFTENLGTSLAQPLHHEPPPARKLGVNSIAAPIPLTDIMLTRLIAVFGDMDEVERNPALHQHLTKLAKKLVDAGKSPNDVIKRLNVLVRETQPTKLRAALQGMREATGFGAASGIAGAINASPPSASAPIMFAALSVIDPILKQLDRLPCCPIAQSCIDATAAAGLAGQYELTPGVLKTTGSLVFSYGVVRNILRLATEYGLPKDTSTPMIRLWHIVLEVGYAFFPAGPINGLIMRPGDEAKDQIRRHLLTRTNILDALLAPDDSPSARERDSICQEITHDIIQTFGKPTFWLPMGTLTVGLAGIVPMRALLADLFQISPDFFPEDSGNAEVTRNALDAITLFPVYSLLGLSFSLALWIESSAHYPPCARWIERIASSVANRLCGPQRPDGEQAAQNAHYVNEAFSIEMEGDERNILSFSL